jgi:hypothetical protein
MAGANGCKANHIVQIPHKYANNIAVIYQKEEEIICQKNT